MKEIKKSFKNLVLFCISMSISTISFADKVTLSCPDPSQVAKQDNNRWSVIIPSTKTLLGNPVSAITLTGQLNTQPEGTNVAFHTKAGMEFNVLNHSISCTYDTQDPTNYEYGKGTQITLTGQTNIFQYFQVADCKIKLRIMSCSN